MWLTREKRGVHCNPKTILRIIEKYSLLAESQCRRKWRQTGQKVHRYKNLRNKEFCAERPNSKCMMDTPPYVFWELYDNTIVTYKTEMEQTASLVLNTASLVMRKEKKRAAAKLQFHSGERFQYASRVYFGLTVLHLLCQYAETVTTTPWRKIPF